MTNRTDSTTILILPFVTLLAALFSSKAIAADGTADAVEFTVRICWIAVLCSGFLLAYFWRGLQQRPALGIYVGFCIFALSLAIRALPSCSPGTHLFSADTSWDYLRTLFQFLGTVVMLYFAGRPLVTFWKNHFSV